MSETKARSSFAATMGLSMFWALVVLILALLTADFLTGPTVEEATVIITLSGKQSAIQAERIHYWDDKVFIKIEDGGWWVVPETAVNVVAPPGVTVRPAVKSDGTSEGSADD